MADDKEAIRKQMSEWGRIGGSTQTENTKRKGFASLTPEERSAISRKGALARSKKQGKRNVSKNT